jgi:hypothetical protein
VSEFSPSLPEFGVLVVFGTTFTVLLQASVISNQKRPRHWIVRMELTPNWLIVSAIGFGLQSSARFVKRRELMRASIPGELCGFILACRQPGQQNRSKGRQRKTWQALS